jgi:hypothetical protein
VNVLDVVQLLWSNSKVVDHGSTLGRSRFGCSALRFLVGFTLAALGIALACGPTVGAEQAGGSRLIYYYRHTSFEPGSGPGSGTTLFTVSNLGPPVSIRFTIFNGANCATFGPTTVALRARETKLLNVADFVLSTSFPSGVIDLWAIDSASFRPIRWDLLTGRSIVIDSGGGGIPLTAASVAAAKLFSDDRTKDDGSLIANAMSPDTFAAAAVQSEVAPQGGGIRDTVVLFSPAVVPGAVPPPPTVGGTFELSFLTFPGVIAASTLVAPQCVYSNTVAAAFPSAPVSGGGRVFAELGPGKGVVGFKFSKIGLPGVNLLLGDLMQSVFASTLKSAAQ